MSFARDKLYSGYLRRKMPIIVSTVKVREIIPHLPCLTDHDRENIEAKRETYGNHDGMVLLLDCLKRRENWPEEFIAAIEACQHTTIAAEIRAEYDSLRGASNSNPSSPPTTVVRAHVHPAPSAIQPPVPESGADSPAAVSPPAEAAAAPPPEPAAQPSPPLQIPARPQAPQSSAAEVPEDVPPPEPVTEPPKAAQIEVAPPPSTPPPSPTTVRSQAAGDLSPRREINFQQEPEENSESDIQGISGDNEVTPDEAGAGKAGEVLIDSVEAPQPPGPVEQSETESPSCSDLLQTTTTTTTTEVGPPRSPSPTENDSDVTEGAPVTTMTPEKPPVQDTTPPAAALEPEETSKPPTKQTVETSPQRETAASVSPLHAAAAAAEMDAPLGDDGNECLSKPCDLISVCPESDAPPTMRAPSPPVEPYSGDSERLEFSEAAPDTMTSPDLPACAALSSTTANSVSAPPCMENGFADNHNEPEENQYDSPSPSLGMQEVLVNVGHVSGEPSILNLAGQNSPPPQAQIVNGEAAKDMKSPLASTDPSDTTSDVKTPSNETYNPPSESAPADISTELKTPQDSEEQTSSCTLPANTKYIVAAGVGVIALLMAWKFKN
ncbi:mitochondrial antiviral-signaling protein isoform X2 [Labrus mixtus]|uniref:mitochondrial antiviral-signaling protein isoform X2 n=1 Tax=Labrus mixtus TaxID=508554 RepID=UPI0029C04F82|nr:mitochondrial antiviral-signaling protein isoform X2 [Labrus mixtus]